MRNIFGSAVVPVKRILLIIMLTAGSGYLFADQTSADRMLKENKEFVDFLDVCMTNFGEKEKDRFFDVYELHFNADVAYLQSDYKLSYNGIFNSQKIQAGLFPDILARYYLDDSKNYLDRIAPEIIKSKNSPARSYLNLAYRDRATSRNFQVMADAQNPRQFSEKIFRYIEAIKISRRAMRFANLALFESRDREMKKYMYGHMFEIEREKGNIFYSRFSGKTGREFTDELNLSFEDYEKRFQKEQGDKKSSPSAAVRVQPSPSPSTQAPALQPTPEPASGAVFEKKVEREVRFRYEKRVAEYLRDAEFGKADDIIAKYIDDFNFKLIQSLLEVLAAKPKEGLALEFDKLKVHHSDNFSRLTKPSMIESFSSKLKVRDDIKRSRVTVEDQQKTDAVRRGEKPSASPSSSASAAPVLSPAPSAK